MTASGRAAPRALRSGDIFNQHGRKPWACVNFITAHDGFTLNDLVIYNEKHNEANGEDNRDGSSTTIVPGTAASKVRRTILAINALRERQMRNMLATLLLSQGTPMITGRRRIRAHPARQQQRLLPGQRDQLGGLGDRGEGAVAESTSCSKLTALRQRTRSCAATGSFTGEYNEELGIKDVTWINLPARR